jgi:hypothetical protein
VSFRLAYLGVTNALALLRLLPMSDRDKDAEILALRHQITVLERLLGGEKVRFTVQVLLPPTRGGPYPWLLRGRLSPPTCLPCFATGLGGWPNSTAPHPSSPNAAAGTPTASGTPTSASITTVPAS